MLTGHGPVSWVDFDQDGDLDLLIGAQIWRNESPSANTPPAAPLNLAASLADGRLWFNWSPATDAQMPSAALSYDLRVGSAPGKSDVVPTWADLGTGLRRVSQFGAIQGTQTFLSAVKLPLGSYSWSVQAVDAARAGGDFAVESRFDFGSGAPLVDSGTATPTANMAVIQGRAPARAGRGGLD